MSGKSSTSIATRSGASAPTIGDPTSTPVASQSSDSRQNSVFVMPETPEQLEELFIRRLAAITSAAQSHSPTPARAYDPSGINLQYGDNPQPAKIQEVPHTSYRNTTPVSCDTLKANRLTENGHDNAKRRDMILKVLKTEDLLTLVNGKRTKPYATHDNPSGYSPRSITYDSGVELILSADDVYLFNHDTARLYMAINVATAENLQFLFPESTLIGDGVQLWKSILGKLFGTTYKDMLEASDKLRKWTIDPSKHLQSDIHNLLILVQRVNEISDNAFPQESILAILYEAISKDPREELRMIATYSSWNKQPLELLLTSLNESHGAHPYISRNVKMHEFKSDVIHYCNNFQEGKCKFGEKCKYKHKINPNYKKEEILINNKNKNNVYNKNNNNGKPQVKRNSNSNNYKGSNNYSNSQNRSKANIGQPPKYSNPNSIPLRNFNNGDSANQYSNNNNSNWLFSKNIANTNNNPRMYVFTAGYGPIKRPDLDDFSNDPDIFEWQYLNRKNDNDNEDLKFYSTDNTESDILIHDFLVNNVKGKINYNADQFLIRASYMLIFRGILQ